MANLQVITLTAAVLHDLRAAGIDVPCINTVTIALADAYDEALQNSFNRNEFLQTAGVKLTNH